MVDLLAPPLRGTLQVDKLPQVVRVHVLGAGRPDLNLGHRDQHLVPDYLHLGRVRLAGSALKLLKKIY